MSHIFNRVVQLMAKLRAPDGCAWDRKQTHDSLKPYLIEEAYEVLEALDDRDPSRLKEELGDLLLQIVFHTQLAREQGTFTLDEVMEQLCDKLIRRHPHVFGTDQQRGSVRTAEEVKVRWEQIKQAEREEAGSSGSALDGVPKILPALLRAYQVQARAARVGFDWTERAQVLEKLDEELGELRAAIDDLDRREPSGEPSADGRLEHVEAELGDVLFTLINLSRFLRVNPEEALRKTIQRFVDRFQFIERAAAAAGRKLQEMSLSQMDALWEEAKRERTPRQ